MTQVPASQEGPSADFEIDIAVNDPRWASEIDPELLTHSGVRTVLNEVGLAETRSYEVSVVFCDDAAIREINLQWRHIDKPTNVLSFPAADFAGRQGPVVLGDIVIAFDTCKREADMAGISLRDHAMHMIIHGCLHLLGYDHEQQDEAMEMENLETALLARMGIADPYRQMAGVREGDRE